MSVGSMRIVYLLSLASSYLAAATFGTVVPIGGHASDLAFDARRSQLYIANFAGKRVDVLSTHDNTLKTSMAVADFVPGSLALSPDNRFLVVTNYWGVPALAPPVPSVMIWDLDANQRSIRPIPNGSNPLAIEFGNGNRAFLVTTNAVYLLDPLTATFQRLEQPPLMCSTPLPVPFATYPPEILRASSGVSGDGHMITVVADTSGDSSCGAGGNASGPVTIQNPETSIIIRYDVSTGQLSARVFVASPPDGPRVVSVDQTGGSVLAGWALVNRSNVVLAEFPYPTGLLNVGGHAFDWSRNTIYAHVPSNVNDSTLDPEPVLHVLDSDNLTVRARIRIPERLAGRAIFSRDMSTLYAISDSGVTVFPIASLAQARRVAAVQEQLVFRATSCENQWMTQTLDIADLGGGHTDFALSVDPSIQGVRFSQTSGTTPASITVEVNPTAFQGSAGTTAVPVRIVSPGSINIVDSVRLLVNTKNPDQRGIIVSLPGNIVDVLADKARGRLYVIRQDRNQVQVIDSTTFETKAVLRTGNTPTQMAMTRDGHHLLVGNDHSQIASMFDLDRLQAESPIVFPPGHYPRSFAVSNTRILAIARNVATLGSNRSVPPAMIDSVDLGGILRSASTSCDVGIYTNSLPADSMLMSSPSGRTVIAMATDSTMVSYNADYDAFQASRKDSDSMSGAFAALSDAIFTIGGGVYNNSLVDIGDIDGGSSINGVVGTQDKILTVRAASPSSDAAVEWVAMGTGEVVRPIHAIEAPITSTALRATGPFGQIGQTILSFMRPLTMLGDGSAIYLSTSGLTVLPVGFDLGVTPPSISSVSNVADGGAVASGSLIQISGTGLSATGGSAPSLPLPTGLAEMCAVVNTGSSNGPMPLPLWTVSPSRIQAQMPYEVSGSATLTIYAPGGRSDPFDFTIQNTAPAIFRSGASATSGLPMVYRASNNDFVAFSNPIHPKDVLIIYVTGLGQTSPTAVTGAAAPSDPLAWANLLPTVTLGSVTLEVTFAGLVPGEVGVYQINAVVPYNISSARQTALTIAQGGASTTFQVRVVNP